MLPLRNVEDWFLTTLELKLRLCPLAGDQLAMSMIFMTVNEVLTSLVLLWVVSAEKLKLVLIFSIKVFRKATVGPKPLSELL